MTIVSTQRICHTTKTEYLEGIPRQRPSVPWASQIILCADFGMWLVMAYPFPSTIGLCLFSPTPEMKDFTGLRKAPSLKRLKHREILKYSKIWSNWSENWPYTDYSSTFPKYPNRQWCTWSTRSTRCRLWNGRINGPTRGSRRANCLFVYSAFALLGPRATGYFGNTSRWVAVKWFWMLKPIA
jgi:hypothetical protein